MSNSGSIQFSEFLMAAVDFETLFTTERLVATFRMIAKSENEITAVQIKDVLGLNSA